MSFFGLGRGDKKSAAKAPSNALRLGNSTPKKEVKPSGSGGVIALPDNSDKAVGLDVIKDMSRFPGWTTILSGPTATGALNVPVHLQEKLIAVKLTNGRVVLAYDPSEIAQLKQRMGLMRAALTDMNVQVEQKNIAVSADILKEIRIAGEGRANQGSSEIRSASVEQFKSWVRAAKEMGATDMHLRISGGSRGEVMVRVDGELEQLPESKVGLTDNQVLLAIKSAYESLADRHSNSDGNFSELETRSCIIDAGLGIPNLRLRFASQRGFYGPKAVIRLLTTEVDNKPMSFDEMGFSPSHMAQFEKAQRLEAGIIFQCGVTGSGKTTAAKTFLETHPRNASASIYQVADPVEYLLRGVHQINVQRSLVTLAESGRKDPYIEVVESLLRMDPDMIDVGEVRDSISARAAANIAKTGHLALGTLHTDSIMGVVNRLVDPSLGLSRAELTAANVLALLSYQALVGKLCQNCATDSKAAISSARLQGRSRDARYIAHVEQVLRDRMKVDVTGLKYKNHEGCSVCRGRGTKGLTIVAEMMTPDDEWLDLSGEGKDRAAWRHYRHTYSDRDLSSPNMEGKTVLEHAIYKAVLGQIDPCGVERFGDLQKFEVLK